MTTRGRKNRTDKLEMLNKDLVKKQAARASLDLEIKDIESQIAEIEHYFLLQETSKLKETLGKRGLSIEDVTKAIENGQLNIKGSGGSK